MSKETEIIDRLEAFYKRVQPVCDSLHKAYREDIDFGLLGKQWEDQELSSRNNSKRLTLTVNRLKQFIYQVVNDYKQSEMASKVLPHDTSEKDKVLAEVRRGIMRSLERKRGGINAYNNAAKTMISGGLGGWRIITDYTDPQSFDQDIKFLPIHDMTTVLVDYEGCIEPDYSDMTDCAVGEKYTPTRFKSEFGIDPKDFGTSSEWCGIWGDSRGPVVTDYWFREETKETLCRVDVGAQRLIQGLPKNMFLSDLTKVAKEKGVPVEVLIQNDQDGKPIKRESTRCKVKLAKLAGRKLIGEVMEWPIDLIPVVIVTGRKTVNNGKVTIEGLIRQSKDAQKSYNYLKSNKTERIALAPKAPFLVPEGGIPKNQEKSWQAMNTAAKPYLIYATEANGKPLPPPHRVDPIQVDSALVEEERSAVDEIKASMGMYDAALGNRSNETSGIAIRTRDQQADTTNYDFTESMVIALRYSTKVVNKLIPKVIDTERQVAMVGEDDKEKVIVVNRLLADGSKDPASYHLDEGEFDTDYEAGPSSATKAQETRENLQALFQAVPNAALPLGPSYIRNSEMRDADKAAETFEQFANMQMPGLFPDKQQQISPQMVAQLQGQLQQMQAQLQQMAPQLDQLQQENAKLVIENQHIRAQTDLEVAKLEIERFKADTDRIKVDAEIKAKNGNMLLAADKQEHDQAIENAELVHGVQMDRRNLHMTGAKHAADHSLKTSAQEQKAQTDAQKSSGSLDKPKS